MVALAIRCSQVGKKWYRRPPTPTPPYHLQAAMIGCCEVCNSGRKYWLGSYLQVNNRHQRSQPSVSKTACKIRTPKYPVGPASMAWNPYAALVELSPFQSHEMKYTAFLYDGTQRVFCCLTTHRVG